MKILQVIDRLEAGGAERVFVDMSNILKSNAVDVSVLLLTEDGILFSELNTSIPIFRLNRNNKFSFSKLKECHKIISQFNIIHCHTRHVFKYISLVHKIFGCKSKLIFQDHSSAQLGKKEVLLMRYFFKPQHYISVSSQRLNWSIEKFRISPKNSYLLENIIRRIASQNDTEKEFELILISNFKKNKNNLFAIEISKNLNQSLLMVGRNQDQEYFDKIIDSIQNNCLIKIDSTVNAAQQIIPKAKFGLHTSKNETGPIVLIEYLAQKIPFLAYEVGEISKILKPHFPEYFIDNFELNNWLARIIEIQNKPVDIEKMNRIFEQYFGEKEYYQKIMTIYQCVLNN